MVIGVAGKFSAGKNQVVRFISEKIDADILDVDALGHEALEERKDVLKERFGTEIIGPNGRVDRKRLGNIVFQDEEKMLALERIVHPLMREKVKDYIDLQPKQAVIINAALLFYMGLNRFCDTVIWVRAPLVKRIRRAKRRDGLSLRETLSRFRAQKKLKYKQIQKNTDIYTIRNNGSIKELKRKVAEFMKMKGL